MEIEIEKIKTFIGFTCRMGKVKYGSAVLADIKNQKSKLVLIDESASDNTQDKYYSQCKFYNAKIISLPQDLITNAIGKPNVKVISILDKMMSENILKHYNI